MKIQKISLILFILIFTISCKDEVPEPAKQQNNKPVLPEVSTDKQTENPDEIKVDEKEKSYNLKLKWNTDRTRIHNSESESRLAYKLGEREISQNWYSKNRFTEKIAKIFEDDTAELESTFNWFYRKSIDVEGVESILDTGIDIDNPNDSYKVFKSIVGAALKITLDEQSKILKIKGSDILLNRSMTALLGKYWYNDTKASGYEKALKQTYNEKDLKQQYSEGFFDLPENPVKIGDTWEIDINYNVTAFGDLSFRIVMKLAEVTIVNGEEIAIIEMKGEFDEDNETNIINEACEIISGEYSGFLRFNINQGEFGDYDREIKVKAAVTKDEKVTIYSFSENKAEKVTMKID